MGEREQWRRTLLAAMANYIDAGSIVAGAVALPILAKHFGFGDSFVSFLGAFSSNAIAAGLGALIGGRVCGPLGRKKIYQWDHAVRVRDAVDRLRAPRMDAADRLLHRGPDGRRGRAGQLDP